jgi:nucleotide-binding universal stress UspA family protein
MTVRDVGRCVLVGVDGSEPALNAVRWAAQEAGRRGVPLRIAVVSIAAEGRDRVADGAGSPDVDDASVLARLHRAEMAARSAAPDIGVEQAVLSGFASERLLRESKLVELIVLGDRGTGGFTGMLLGSVAGAVAASADCPVVVVREPVRVGAQAPVVVGVDGSALSEAAISFAFEAADARAVPLWAVHSWHDRMLDPADAPFLDWAAMEAREHEVLAQRLAGWAEKYPDVPLRRLVSRERPARVLVAQSRDAQLVVVGSRGRGGVVGDLLGSVSQAVLHHAHCPVAVVHPGRRRAR